MLYLAKNFIAVRKTPGPGCAAADLAAKPERRSRCSDGRRRGAACSPFTPAGKCGCAPFLGGPPLKWGERLFYQRKPPPCPGFLGRSWAGAFPCVTSRLGMEDLCDGGRLAQGSEKDAWGAVRVRREQL